MSSPVVETLSFQAFQRCETAWDELVETAATPNPFLTHGWLRVWWRHFGAGAEFEARVVREGDRLRAAVPLAVRAPRFATGGLRVVEIVGTAPVPTRGMGLADRADVVSRRGDAEAHDLLARQLASELDRAAVFDLKGCDADSPTRPALEQAASGRVYVLPRSVSPYVDLPATWEDYLASRSGNFRKHLRKYRRSLDHLGRWSVERIDTRAEDERWWHEVLQVNAASWKARRGTNLFRHPRLQGFFHDLLRESASTGRVDLHLLRLEGDAIAYELCFELAGRLCSYNSSFRAERAALSPGAVLTAAVIEAACGRGCHEYDLLRGEEGYKSRWGEGERRELELIVPGRGALARGYARLGPYAKGRLKGSPSLVALVDRASGALNRTRHGS